MSHNTQRHKRLKKVFVVLHEELKVSYKTPPYKPEFGLFHLSQHSSWIDTNELRLPLAGTETKNERLCIISWKRLMET